MTHVYVANFCDQPTIDMLNDDHDVLDLETEASPQFHSVHAQWTQAEIDKLLEAVTDEAAYLLDKRPRVQHLVGPWVKPERGREYQIVEVETFDEDLKEWSFFAQIVVQKVEVQ